VNKMAKKLILLILSVLLSYQQVNCLSKHYFKAIAAGIAYKSLNFGSVKCEDGQKSVEQIKQKWMDWANARVEAERDLFFKKYGLDDSYLPDSETIEFFKSSHDKQLEEQDLILAACEDEASCVAPVKEIAAKIFEKCDKIHVLDQQGFDHNQVAVLKKHKDNSCYVALNCEKHLKDVEQLKEILRHEYSHILHEDNFNYDLIQYGAWSKSNADRSTIEEQFLPYHRAFETRADVYAAITSPSYGAHLITFLKNSPYYDEETLTHPKDSDRIALLEKIKSELESAQ
jgi:hypothetical protein